MKYILSVVIITITEPEPAVQPLSAEIGQLKNVGTKLGLTLYSEIPINLTKIFSFG